MTPALPLLSAADNRGAAARPLVVTATPDLLDDLLRLAAAAGVTLTVAAEPTAVRRHWAGAPLVLIDMDQVDACLAAGLPERRHVILIGGHVDDGRVWDASVRLGADHVIFLPEAEPWIVDLLSDLDGLDRHRSVTIGLVSGQPGTGASTLAVSLALTGLRRDLRTMLIDADPLGGGLAPAFAEQAPALAPAFHAGDLPDPRHPLSRLDPTTDQATESIGPVTWSDLLPRRGDLSVVSWDPSISPAVPPATMATLLSTARCTSDLVIVDLPSGAGPASTVALRVCQTVLVVTPADMRSVLATERVSSAVIRQCPDVRAVVRVGPSDELVPASVAKMLGLPLAGAITGTSERSAHRRPGCGPRGGTTVRRFGEELLSGMGMDGPHAWPRPETW